MREHRGNALASDIVSAAAAVLLVVSGAVGAREPAPAPTFVAPAAFEGAPATDAAGIDGTAFWHGFGDPALTRLVEQALAANTDVRVAMARVDSANALLRGASADRWPTLTAEAGGAHQRLAAVEAPGVTRADRDAGSTSAGARLAWELDVFGRVRHGVAARRAEADATAADLQALRVSIVADVSRSYFTLRGLQAQRRVARENVASQTETLRLVTAGLDAGRGTAFDTSRARAQLASTRARVPALDARIATMRHHLAVLVGQAPGTPLAGLDDDDAALPSLPPAVDPGTPGDVLARRPDVAAAQARLQAAIARIGVAHSEMFPRFTLGGLLGSVAGDGGGLFHRDGERRLVALGIDWSFLDIGRTRARLASARADADAEVARYEQVLLRALQETEDALVRLDRARVEGAELASAADDGVTAARLARIRYEAGAADLFEVLDAERVLLQAQEAEMQARTRTLEHAVELYRALAGDWEPVRR